MQPLEPAKEVAFGKWRLLPTVGDLWFKDTPVTRLRKAEERLVLILLSVYPGALPVWRIVDAGRWKQQNTVKVHVKNIRAKTCHAFIENPGPGRGYRINPDAEPPEEMNA